MIAFFCRCSFKGTDKRAKANYRMVEKNSMEPHGHLDHFNYTASLRVGDQIQLNCNDTGLSITECMKKGLKTVHSHYSGKLKSFSF